MRNKRLQRQPPVTNFVNLLRNSHGGKETMDYICGALLRITKNTKKIRNRMTPMVRNIKKRTGLAEAGMVRKALLFLGFLFFRFAITSGSSS